MLVTGGTTDVTTYFQMRLTAGGDATGLTITDFDLSYTRTGAATAAKVDATDLGSANAAHSDNGGYEVDPTDCPGLHRFDWPDAAFAAGVKEVILTVKHSSCFTESLRVEIDPPVDAVAISGSSTAADNVEVVYDTDFATNYNTTNDKWQTEADVVKWLGQACAAVSVNGVPEVDVTHIAGSTTVDTVSLTNVAEILLAYINGKIAVTSNAYAYKKQDGTTTKMTHTMTNSTRTPS